MADQLDCELWFLELSELLESCETAQEAEQGEILTSLFSLCVMAPQEWSYLFEPRPSQQAFDAHIKAAAYVDGVISLLGDDTGFMLSKPPREHAIASIFLPGVDEELHAEGKTEAIALAAALMTAVFRQVGATVDFHN